jgi:hypothetical protein
VPFACAFTFAARDFFGSALLLCAALFALSRSAAGESALLGLWRELIGLDWGLDLAIGILSQKNTIKKLSGTKVFF